MTDERPTEPLRDTTWPGFSRDDVRAQEAELRDEHGAPTAEPQGAGAPPGSTAARGVAILGIVALLALLGALAAVLVLGADDPQGASAAHHGAESSGRGTLRRRPPRANRDR